jgi:hypothetical protein
LSEIEKRQHLLFKLEYSIFLCIGFDYFAILFVFCF